MAVDHALAACLDGGAVARLYGWERPTLSFGRNEPAGAYASAGERLAGVDFVRRPTGGRAVLHHRELTYAVVVPVGAWGGPREAYRRINQALVRALRSLGAPVDLSSGVPSLAPDAGPCFQAPAPGEVVAQGKKLVGSAQARIGGALLQHGSILLADDQSRLGYCPGGGADVGGPITLAELIGDVSIDEVARAVAESLPGGLGGAWSAGDLSASERDAADRLEANTYARDSWTWRR